MTSATTIATSDTAVSSSSRPTPKDENSSPNVTTTSALPSDPRQQPGSSNTKAKKKKGGGRNTESFDPSSTLVRPDLRVLIGNPSLARYNKPLKHDDVVMVPELFGPEDNWDNYHSLVQEIIALQESGTKGSDMISWHEGAHLICQQPPKASPKFQAIIQRLCDYFDIDARSAGTRFNWYPHSQDWKPFHHDSAAFNPQRAKHQNITVGVSFGATRELAFLHAAAHDKLDGNNSNDNKPVRLYFPQTNNGVFTFGRDVNIQWKHGINALPPPNEQQLLDNEKQGRISIILWGLARNVIEEDGSPAMLGADGTGPHAPKNNNKKYNNNKKGRRGGRGQGSGGRGKGGNNNNEKPNQRGDKDSNNNNTSNKENSNNISNKNQKNNHKQGDQGRD